MHIIRIVTFAVATMMMLKLTVNHGEKGYSVPIRTFASALLLSLIIPEIRVVLGLVEKIGGLMTLKETYLLIVFKIIGVAYIAEFGYQLCKDSGEEALGAQVQLAGKVIILVLASPIAYALVELITKLI